MIQEAKSLSFLYYTELRRGASIQIIHDKIKRKQKGFDESLSQSAKSL
jgi:hypothetical protein